MRPCATPFGELLFSGKANLSYLQPPMANLDMPKPQKKTPEQVRGDVSFRCCGHYYCAGGHTNIKAGMPEAS